MPLNGSAPTNKRNGLAISRIDGGDCFIRDDKTDRGREGEGRGQERERETQATRDSHPRGSRPTRSHTHLTAVDKARHKINFTDNHLEHRGMGTAPYTVSPTHKACMEV